MHAADRFTTATDGTPVRVVNGEGSKLFPYHAALA
jgi:hypothetical protein